MRILVLNFFPAFHPAASGGELRVGNLYRAVAREHDVTMLTATDFGARTEFVHHAPRFREWRFPKDVFWRRAYAALDRAGLEGEPSGLGFALATADPACPLTAKARELAAGVDLIVHEFPFSEPIFADGAPAPEIYNSHNFEASLLASIFTGPGLDRAFAKLVRLEGNLVRRAARVFATSQPDADKFRLFYGVEPARLALAPNGFAPDELAPIVAARQAREVGGRRLLFLGSAHAPNVEAARFLFELAGGLPDCTLILAGGVCHAVEALPRPANLRLEGPFDDAAKHRLLSEADIFLNPLTLGSGTSLKALEALGATVPMVSTPEGVRGLELTPGLHAEIVGREDFRTAIERLLAEPTRAAKLAAAGRAHAEARYAWDRIADDLLAVLERPSGPPGEPRPFALAFNDYPVLQPGSGGVARVRNLLAHGGCDVVLLSFGGAYEFGLIGADLLHVTVPKTAAHQAFEDAVNAGEAVSCNDGVASLFAAANPALAALAGRLAARAGLVLFEHPYMAPLLDDLLAARPSLPVVYSAHNVETVLKAGSLAAHRLGDTLVRLVADVEAALLRHAALVVCCTDSDAEWFAATGAETLVVPNGCDLPAAAALKHARRAGRPAGVRAGFLGSAHGPNLEAALWIVETLAPAFPQVEFELIGSVCGVLPPDGSENVRRLGLVDEARKTERIANWDIALNPVASGGGSSLKLPDCLAHAVPTLNTPAGARGFDVERHGAGRTVPREDFAAALQAMLDDPEALQRQRTKARRYAEQELQWPAITRGYREALARLAAPAPAIRPRLLVVAEQDPEPPRGPEAGYLAELLTRLRHRFARVDLAAIDGSGEGAAARLGELFDRALYFPADAVDPAGRAEAERAVERGWAREEQRRLLPLLGELAASDRPQLFGGFHPPSVGGGRLTTPEFAFLVPADTQLLEIEGEAPGERMLALRIEKLARDGTLTPAGGMEHRLAGPFRLALPLPREGMPLLLSLAAAGAPALHEGRPLGLVLTDAAILRGPAGDAGLAPLEKLPIDLAGDPLDALRARRPDLWASGLRDAAYARDGELDAHVAELTGGRSGALQAWLAANASAYDVVLVQAPATDLLATTVETLTALARHPRIVVLPHFDPDDRRHHWRRLYEALDAADATLLFSERARALLGDPDHATIVPGGGVEPAAHADPRAPRRFRDVDADETPFFLVLDGGEGCRAALAAHAEYRRQGGVAELVVIARSDEAAAPPAAEGVVWLGSQPGAVVDGALRLCLALVAIAPSPGDPTILWEAWLAGRPVIADRAVPALSALVEDGVTGLLVDAGEQLVQAMTSLSGDPRRSARMGAEGFRVAVRDGSWSAVAARAGAALVGGARP